MKLINAADVESSLNAVKTSKSSIDADTSDILPDTITMEVVTDMLNKNDNFVKNQERCLRGTADNTVSIVNKNRTPVIDEDIALSEMTNCPPDNRHEVIRLTAEGTFTSPNAAFTTESSCLELFVDLTADEELGENYDFLTMSDIVVISDGYHNDIEHVMDAALISKNILSHDSFVSKMESARSACAEIEISFLNVLNDIDMGEFRYDDLASYYCDRDNECV